MWWQSNAAYASRFQFIIHSKKKKEKKKKDCPPEPKQVAGLGLASLGVFKASTELPGAPLRADQAGTASL